MLSRRKSLKLLSLLGVSSIAAVATCTRSGQQSLSIKNTRFLKNLQLRSIKARFPGNMFSNQQFFGEYTSKSGDSFLKVMKWRLTRNPQADEKKGELFNLPVIKHDQQPRIKSDYMMWLGHASFLLQLGGKSILIDPCLTAPPMMTRRTELPLPIEKIHADYLLASHGHYDHLDSDSIKTLSGKSTVALLPLKMGELVKDWNPNMAVQEAGWYQQYTTDKSVSIYFMPARHWHRRSAFDLNEILWGSYIIQSGGKTIYFAGDTSYDSHFKEIGKLFPKIDYAILPIGAYKPEFMMKQSHINPEEAHQAFQDLNAKTMIPMHYGTFDLSDEPLSEPRTWLDEIAAKKKISNRIKHLDIGEIFKV